jgi:osmotically-inducible protein OsmY
MSDYYRDYGNQRYGRRYDKDEERHGRRYGREEDRGFLERAGDEVRSWFGDEEAERRRRMDEEEDEAHYRTDYSRADYDRSGYERTGYDRDSYTGSEYGRGARRREGYRGEYERGTGYGRGGSRGEYDRGFTERSGGSSDPYRRTFGTYGERGHAGSREYGRMSDYETGESSSMPYTYRAYSETWYIPGPYTGLGPSGWRRSDERINEEINERLAQHGQIDATNMIVSVTSGEVILSGSVNSRLEKRLAEDVAESCSGVREVQNNLRVIPREASQSWSPSTQATSQYQTGQTGQMGQTEQTGQTEQRTPSRTRSTSS